MNIRRKEKKRGLNRDSEPLIVPESIKQCWNTDFMSDALWCGQRFRIFNLVDYFNREVLAIEVDKSLPSERVGRILDDVATWRGYPRKLRDDNGTELNSAGLADWAD